MQDSRFTPPCRPYGMYELEIRLGPHAGKVVMAYEYHGKMICPELDCEFPKSRIWDAGDEPQPGAHYKNLGTPWDGEGRRICVGDRVLYSKDGKVRRGTVEAYGKRSKTEGSRTISIKIREDADCRDFDFVKSQGLFICNDPTTCLKVGI